MSWLERLRNLDSESVCQCQPCQPCQNNPIGRERGGVINLPDHPGTVGTVGTGTSPEIEPGADAPAHVWPAWFDRQIAIINQDLAAEGTTLGKVLTAMRPKRRRYSLEEIRSAAFARRYAANFMPRPGAPESVCVCGERVWYQLRGDIAWRCRSCQPVDAHWRVRWFVT